MPKRPPKHPYPPFSGPIPLDGTWLATQEAYQFTPIGVTAEGLTLPIPVAPGPPPPPAPPPPHDTVNYVYHPANRGLLVGQTLTIRGEIRTTGTPVFHTTYVDGYGAPPNLRLFVWCWNLTYAGTPASGRIWAPVFHVLAPGPFTLSAAIDAAWNGLDGHPPADLADALVHSTAVGFTCGGGDASGHGVSVTDGTAEIVVLDASLS